MGLLVVPTSGNVSRTPGAARCCCGCRWPWPVLGHTDGQGCRGGGHSTARGNPPASCPPGLPRPRGYSRPRVTPDPALLRSSGSFLPLSLGILTIQGPYSALGWLAAHPAVPSHTPQRRSLELGPHPSLSCRPRCPLPQRCALRMCSWAGDVDSDMGSALWLAIHSACHPGSAPAHLGGKGRLPGTPPLPGHSLP